MKQNFVIVRKTPLSALRAAQSEFSSPRHVFRAHHYQNAAASPFLHEPQVCGKLSALTERRGFRTRRNCLHSSHNFFRADERKSREAGGNLPCVAAQNCAAYWRRFLPSAARRVKAPWQTVRYACRLARRACRSSFPKISLCCDFREPCLFLGHAFFMRAAFTSIRILIMEKRQKRGFAVFSCLFLRYPKFYILHSTFYIFAPRRELCELKIQRAHAHACALFYPSSAILAASSVSSLLLFWLSFRHFSSSSFSSRVRYSISL